MVKLPAIKVKSVKRRIVFVQGGMGIGVSMAELARAVAAWGKNRRIGQAIGTLSSAALEKVASAMLGRKVNASDAAEFEVGRAKLKGGFIAINCMVAAARSYKNSIFGALKAKVDAIISGAGLPMALPEIVEEFENTYHTGHQAALIPIVSSAKAAELIMKRWARKKRSPDAFVLEGPLAGGHLGFKFADVNKEENRLENLIPRVRESIDRAQLQLFPAEFESCGRIPLIAAGGIFYHQDIVNLANEYDIDGVQLATRFLVTHECSAAEAFKNAAIAAAEEDIMIAENPGSPCGLPFRVIKTSPGYVIVQEKKRKPHCRPDLGFVLRKDEAGEYTVCPAKASCDYFDVCEGLDCAHKYGADPSKAVYTIGKRGYLLDRRLSVDELMKELILGE